KSLPVIWKGQRSLKRAYTESSCGASDVTVRGLDGGTATIGGTKRPGTEVFNPAPRYGLPPPDIYNNSPEPSFLVPSSGSSQASIVSIPEPVMTRDKTTGSNVVPVHWDCSHELQITPAELQLLSSCRNSHDMV